MKEYNSYHLSFLIIKCTKKSLVGVVEHCYKEICPELLARTLSDPNMEKFNIYTLSLDQYISLKTAI